MTFHLENNNNNDDDLMKILYHIIFRCTKIVPIE